MHGTVVEFVEVFYQSWSQYLSCCPPGSKTNQSPYYRCNSWTTDKNNNCHTTGLPWNDGKIVQPGKLADSGVPGSFMYSYPAEGEGLTWTQGFARRILSTDLAQAWRDAAGGCAQCQTQKLEDPCIGLCIQALGTDNLTSIFNSVAADLTK